MHWNPHSRGSKNTVTHGYLGRGALHLDIEIRSLQKVLVSQLKHRAFVFGGTLLHLLSQEASKAILKFDHTGSSFWGLIGGERRNSAWLVLTGVDMALRRWRGSITGTAKLGLNLPFIGFLRLASSSSPTIIRLQYYNKKICDAVRTHIYNQYVSKSTGATTLDIARETRLRIQGFLAPPDHGRRYGITLAFPRERKRSADNWVKL